MDSVSLAVLLLGLISLNITNAPWYFSVIIVILYAAWTIASAIRDGSDKISRSLDAITREIHCARQEIKEAILEQKLK